MPRITETLKQLTDEASAHYIQGHADLGSNLTNYVNSRALIEIADSLKSLDSKLQGIDASLDAIKSAIGDYIASAEHLAAERTTLEEPPAGAESSGARSRKRPAAKK